MPRLNVVDPATATGKTKELFDGPLKGKHLNIFKGFANSPAALEAYLNLSGALAGGSLSKKEGEVVALTMGESSGCDYCTAAHTTLGKMAGLTDEQTVQARQGHVDGDPKLDAVAKFTSALYEKRGHVSDDDLAKFRAVGFDDGAVAEVVGHFALNTLTNYFNHVNNTAVDFPSPPKIG